MQHQPITLPALDRATIEVLIEMMIERLDALDGDPDWEDGHEAEAVNEDGDDNGGYGDYMPAPVYGIDQTKLPLNEAEMQVAAQELRNRELDAAYERLIGRMEADRRSVHAGSNCC